MVGKLKRKENEENEPKGCEKPFIKESHRNYYSFDRGV